MGFYGHPDTAKRKEAWNFLRHLSLFQPLQWLCIGDFNKIVDLLEKKGKALRSRSQMMAFQGVLEDCGLHDLGYMGLKFTWNNGRFGEHFT